MSARRPAKLSRLETLRRQLEEARRARQQADALTADGYPPGHPLRTLCLLSSGPAGVAQLAHEQTQQMIKDSRK